jgi:hypothetical protein
LTESSRKKPRTISISRELEERVDEYARANRMRSFSEAVCRILEETIPAPSPQELRRRAREEHQARIRPIVQSFTSCPECGGPIVSFSDFWRCSICMEERSL